MKIGVFASFMTPATSPRHILDIGRHADAAELDSLWMGEHVVLFDEMEFPYPGSPDGKLPVPAGAGLPDTVVTLGFLAGVTENLRFGTGVSLIPQRNPIYTANEFATLDYLTGGRVDLGIGVGWCKEEVEACGYSFEDRGERCDEILDIMQRLWTEPVVSHQGKHFQFEGCRMDPKPVQQQLPIIVGGFSKPAMRRCARYGSGWLGFGINPEITKVALQGIDAALAAEDRSRADFEIIVTPGVEVTLDVVKQFQDIGVDRVVPLLATDDFDAALRRIDLLAEIAAEMA